MVLTATFLALAAGGAAACDAPAEYAEPPAPVVADAEPAEEEESRPAGEVFYCADEDGEVVEEEHCAGEGAGGYFLWHSAAYGRGLGVGSRLDGGDSFPADDRAARKSFRLPAAGRVANGTVKTNIVGQGSSGSTVTSGTTSGG